MIERLGSESVPAGAGADAAKVKDAARQFEALLIGQMLRSMREAASGGWLGTGEDQTASSMMEVAEEHLARAMAEQGGIGLANMVVEGMSKPAGSVNSEALAERPVPVVQDEACPKGDR